MKKILLAVLIFLTDRAFAQVEQKNAITPEEITESEEFEKNKDIPGDKKKITYFTLDDWRKSFNRSFVTVLGGAGTTEDIGNYASFDPINGSFIFKGSILIGRKERKNLSFLSFAVKGNILSRDYFKRVIVAIAIGLPVTQLSASAWLDNYATRASLMKYLFFGPTLTMLLLMPVSIGMKTIATALLDLVNSLRSE